MSETENLPAVKNGHLPPLELELPQDAIMALVTTGDVSRLTPEQFTEFYIWRCRSVGLRPESTPFQRIKLSGRDTLYATKECSAQLIASRHLDVVIIEEKILGKHLIMKARAEHPDGRGADDYGVVTLGKKDGDDFANAYMKCATKAKRRAVLSLCGLGMPDESELETIPVRSRSVTDKQKAQGLLAADAVAREKIAKLQAQYAEHHAGETAAEIGSAETQPDVEQTAEPQRQGDANRFTTMLATFGKMKTIIGPEQYYRCLGAHGVVHANEFRKLNLARACYAEMREVAKGIAERKESAPEGEKGG